MAENTTIRKPTQNLSLTIELAIEKSIRDKEYRAGEKLPTENEYCQRFSASRTAVREALKSLNSRGLVDIKKGSGIYVTELSAKGGIDLLNFYFEMSEDSDLVLNTIKARQFFEPEIAAQAALRRSSENLEALWQNLQKLSDSPYEDIEQETLIDLEFHSLITESASNPVVKIIMEPIFNIIPRYNNKIYGKDPLINDMERKQLTLKFHTRIYQAILNKDSREAYYQMKESLLDTEKKHLAYQRLLD